VHPILRSRLRAMKYLIHEIEFISDRPNLLLVSFKLERCVLLKKLLMERGFHTYPTRASSYSGMGILPLAENAATSQFEASLTLPLYSKFSVKTSALL